MTTRDYTLQKLKSTCDANTDYIHAMDDVVNINNWRKNYNNNNN